MRRDCYIRLDLSSLIQSKIRDTLADSDDQPKTSLSTSVPTTATRAEITPIHLLASVAQSSELLVEVGDHVTYSIQAPQGEERLTIQIVDSPSSPRLNLVNEASPLAQALIGLCEGDESHLVVRGHESKTLRVISIARPVKGHAVPPATTRLIGT